MTSERKEIIQVGKILYPFPRLNYETDASYFLRKDFFIKAGAKTEKEYLNAVSMSITWASMKILGCAYPAEVQENLKKLVG